jgi:deaminated glutathione amidase
MARRRRRLRSITMGRCMIPFAIAGIQMKVSATESNLAAMTRRLDVLMHRFPWVQMVMFSELCVLGPLRANAQPLPGPIEHSFCELAAQHGIWLIPGSMFERVGDRVCNTASVIDPDGQVVGRYRKMFPFQPYEQAIEPGHEFLVFDVPGVGRFGVSICYDVWFPETSRTLTALGAEVILHPTLTDTIDRDVELSIVRATAAMNQCYVFDVNGIGDGGYGRSSVVDPSGHVLYSAAGGEEMIPVEIDLERVRRDRAVGIRGLGQPLKSFRDRRVEFDVYRPEAFDNTYLESLGALERASRGSRAGLDAGSQAEPVGAPAAYPLPAEAESAG